MRLRFDLAYDGSDFHGWARQPGLRTVQGEIEAALRKVLHMNRDLRLTVAGRTDAGVHASHQVCHLDVDDIDLERCIGHMGVGGPEALRRRLCHILPSDISLLRVATAPEGFDARFSALERTYIYRISDGLRAPDPRMRGFVLSLDDILDIDLMNQAAQMSIGLHDFGSFATPNPGGTTIREVKYAHWQRLEKTTVDGAVHACEPSQTSHMSAYAMPSLESGIVMFTIVADAFAHNMVRSLVNACVRVGVRKKNLDWFDDKMAHPQREGATGPIAAKGLTLEHVAYPPDGQLAARADAIRARRTL